MTRQKTGLMRAWCTATALAACAVPAFAIDDPPGDWDALKSCEKRLCTMILGREEKGGDLSCKLAKTWAKSTLDGSESKLVTWGYGDARCTVDLALSRTGVVSALSERKYKLEVPEHHVKCQVESEGKTSPIDVKLAPTIEFKNGKAHKIWINLKDVSGPTAIKSTVWAAAKLEDGLGIFHKSMVKSANKFMHRQCAERYGPAAGQPTSKKKRKGGTEASLDAAGATTESAAAVAQPTTAAPAEANAP